MIDSCWTWVESETMTLIGWFQSCDQNSDRVSEKFTTREIEFFILLSLIPPFLEYGNRLLKIARMTLAYFKVGPLQSLCEYLNDWVFFPQSLSLSVWEGLNARHVFYSLHSQLEKPVCLSADQSTSFDGLEIKSCFFTDSISLSGTE